MIEETHLSFFISLKIRILRLRISNRKRVYLKNFFRKIIPMPSMFFQITIAEVKTRVTYFAQKYCKLFVRPAMAGVGSPTSLKHISVSRRFSGILAL